MHFQISLIAPWSTQEMEGTICNCCTSGYASVVSSQECILAWPWKRCAGLRWTLMAAVYMLSCSSLNVYWSIDTICFSINDIIDITCTYVYRYMYRSKMKVLSVHSWWLIEPPKLLDPILSIYVIACWSLFQWQLTTGSPFSTGLHQLAQQCAARTNAAALWWRAHSGVGTTVSWCFSRIDQRVERTPKARPL